uniref:Uncharacterized protein n=1 Tax=Panagrolaimus davidi TaxID=227884 RepID=A0A914P171_9BILA
MTHKSLHSINEQPNLLETYFPVHYFDEIFKRINETAICSKDIHEMFKFKYPEKEWKDVQYIVDYYDSLARGLSRNDNTSWYSGGKYDILWDESETGRTEHRYSFYAETRKPPSLEIRYDQFQMLKHYPVALKSLLPVLDIPWNIRYSQKKHASIANNPEILESILFNSTTIYDKDPDQIMLFGGAFKSGTLNPFTGTYDCPPNFEPLQILFDLNLCLSTDNSLKWPLRLGGLFDCNSDKKVCPLGYSEYLGNVIDECEYYYCIRFHSRDNIFPPIINRPPYTDYKAANAEAIPSN